MATTEGGATGADDGGPVLRRELGLFDATCVVIGAIVGVGIFFTPSGVARSAGDASTALWAWAAGGVLAMLGALCFAELGGRVRESGGQFEILRRAYGDLVGFLFVFCNAVAIQSGAIAIIAWLCVLNLVELVLPAGSDPSTPLRVLLSVLLIVGVTGANWLGVKIGSRIQNVTVIAKVATILLVTALGILYGTGGEGLDPVTLATDAPVPKPPSLPFLAALVPVLFSFGGWQHALWIGGEVRAPERNVPRAILIGVAVTTACYLLVNFAYFRLLGYDGVRGAEALAANAVQTVWPNVGKRLVAGAVAFSAFGVLNAQLLSGPRLVYAMARSGKFFRVFDRVHPVHATPSAAIVFLGALGFAMCLPLLKWGTLDPLLNGVVLVDGLFMAVTGAAVLVLRRKEAALPGGFRVPGFVPALFVLGELGVIAGAFSAQESSIRQWAWVSALSVAVGAVLYFALFAKPSRAASS